jgi:hypothetical protein
MHSGSSLILEDHQMALPFRRSFGAFMFALAATFAAAQPVPATAQDRGADPLQARTACATAHRFEPGPILAGRNRQPTVFDFQARIQELGESELRDAYSCAALPVGN